MTKAELLAETRSVVKDKVAPYFWSDLRLLRWLAEGQDKFCANTGFWLDKTSYTIVTVLGQQDYVFSSRIISVRSIWDGTRELVDLTGKTLISSEDFADNPTQSPVNYRTNLATRTVTFLEPVSAGVTLTLRAHRKSLVALSAATGEPEIDDDFQLAMVEYAAAKALSDHDAETQDPVKATDHMKNFKAYCKDGARAYRRLTGEYTDVVPNPLYVV